MAANAAVVAEIAGDLTARLADIFTTGDDVLVLGGDCTVELGTVGAAIADGSSVALVYVDLDTDLHTPATGDGVLDWMGVAHILDVPGAHPGLAGLHHRRPMLDPRAVRLVATANITEPEQRHIDDLGIHVDTLEDVTARLDEVLARTAAWAREYDRILVHVDVDVLDYDRFPIAENTGRRGGLELDQLTRLLTGLCALPNWRALTVAEINPAHAPDEPTSFGRLIECLVQSLSPRSGAGSNPPARAR